MDAQEIVLQIRENSQIFSREPLRDGFADDIVAAPTTRILPQANKVYRRLIEKGIYQCWHRLTMTAAVSAYRTSGKFTLALQAYLRDPVSEATYKLDQENIPHADSAYRPYFRDLRSARPERFVFTGNMVAFNSLPDAAYQAYFLADSLPAPLILRTDTPSALDEQFHDAIVSGAAVYIARMALSAGDITQGQMLLYRELDREWQDYKQQVEDVQTSRMLYVSDKPRMVVSYRVNSTRLRR